MINLTTYISKVLKTVHADTGITKSALDEMNAIINFVGQDVAGKSVLLTETVRTKKGKTYIPRKTITSRSVQSAVSLIFPGELGKHAVSEGTRAVTKYNSSIAGDKSAPMTKALRSGLIFSPSKGKVGAFFSIYSKNVGATASVYFAGALEYLTAEILDFAGTLAREGGKKRINVRHLFLSMANDKELDQLMKKYRLVVAGGGVTQELLRPLVPTKEQKSKQAYQRAKARRERGEEGVEGKKEHRFLPGTKALREIKKHQKDSLCVYFQRAPFERLTKDLLHNHAADVRVSKASLNALQYYVESYLIDLLRDANRLAVYNDRQRLFAKDVQFIHDLRKEN